MLQSLFVWEDLTKSKAGPHSFRLLCCRTKRTRSICQPTWIKLLKNIHYCMCLKMPLSRTPFDHKLTLSNILFPVLNKLCSFAFFLLPSFLFSCFSAPWQKNWLRVSNLLSLHFCSLISCLLQIPSVAPPMLWMVKSREPFWCILSCMLAHHSEARNC